MHKQSAHPRALEQGHARRAEGPAQTQGSLGDPGSPANGEPRPGVALFDLGIDTKLRACDLVKLRLRDVCLGDRVASRATVLQQKTQQPVQFEISLANREAVEAWIRKAGLKSDDYLFPRRVRRSPHLLQQ